MLRAAASCVRPRGGSAVGWLGERSGRSLATTANAGWVAVEASVQEALSHRKAVVALESTIICHGMPYPQNVETAIAVQKIVKDAGATPATIAIFDGKVHVGVTDEELERLGKEGPAVRKCSRRDIAPTLAARITGATTVSGTLCAASLVPGIDIMVTGGIGGVHRGGETTMDVSADLTELGRTPMTVVCAGAKSVLDIGRTLEYLETQGVTVGAFQSDYFPAFFSPSSGFKVPCRVNTEEALAKVVHAHNVLGLKSGMLFGVPYTQAAENVEKMIDEATETAVKECAAKGITGQAVTPFLLKRIVELTGGESLRANIGLVKNNARVGAKAASFLSRLHTTRGFATVSEARRRPVIVGGAVIDLISSPASGYKVVMGSKTPGHVSQSYGGVGRNVAEAAARLGAQPSLVTVASGTGLGVGLLAHCESVGIDTAHISKSVSGNAVYSAMLNEKGDLVASISDMDAFNAMTPDFVKGVQPVIAEASVVAIDSNIPAETIAAAAKMATGPVIVEPTSLAKCVRVVEANALHWVSVIKPNQDEVMAMAKAIAGGRGIQVEEASSDDESKDGSEESETFVTGDGQSLKDSDAFELDSRVLAAAQLVLARMCTPIDGEMGQLVDGLKHVLVSMGAEGVLWLMCRPLTPAEWKEAADELNKSHNTNITSASSLDGLQPFFALADDMGFTYHMVDAPAAKVVNVTGAGDTMVGAIVWALHGGHDMGEALAAGIQSAKLSVECQEAVPPHLSPSLLQ